MKKKPECTPIELLKFQQNVYPKAQLSVQTEEIKQHSTLDPALIDSDLNALALFRYDYGKPDPGTKRGIKRKWRAMSYETLFRMFKVCPKNDFLYHEIILHDRYAKLYLELDGDCPSIQYLDFVGSCYKIVKCLCKFLGDLFESIKEDPLDPIEDFVYLIASTTKKHSMHIIMDCKKRSRNIYLKNKQHLWHLMNIFRLHLATIEVKEWTSNRAYAESHDRLSMFILKKGFCYRSVLQYKTNEDITREIARKSEIETETKGISVPVCRNKARKIEPKVATGPINRSKRLIEHNEFVPHPVCMIDVVSSLRAMTLADVMDNEDDVNRPEGNEEPDRGYNFPASVAPFINRKIDLRDPIIDSLRSAGRLHDKSIIDEYNTLESLTTNEDSSCIEVMVFDQMIDMQVYAKGTNPDKDDDKPTSLRTFYSIKAEYADIPESRLRNCVITVLNSTAGKESVSYKVEDGYNEEVMKRSLVHYFPEMHDDGDQTTPEIIAMIDYKMDDVMSMLMKAKIEYTYTVGTSQHKCAKEIRIPYVGNGTMSQICPQQSSHLSKDDILRAIRMCYATKGVAKRGISTRQQMGSSVFSWIDPSLNDEFSEALRRLVEETYASHLRSVFKRDKLAHPRYVSAKMSAVSGWKPNPLSMDKEQFPVISIIYIDARCEIKEMISPGYRHTDFADKDFDMGCCYLIADLNTGYFHQKCWKEGCRNEASTAGLYEVLNEEITKLGIKEKKELLDKKGYYYPGKGRTLRIPRDILDTLKKRVPNKR